MIRILLFIYWFLACHTKGQLSDVTLSGTLDILQSTFLDQWRPKGVPDKNDLCCPSQTIISCQSRSVTVDECCNCEAKPIWEGKEQPLSIEYLTVLGKTMVLHENPSTIKSVYKIQHSNGEMSQIPINICNYDLSSQKTVNEILTSAQVIANISAFWPRIVKMDFSSNKLSEIGDLTCLTALDTLDLSSNRITHLSNTSFINLSHLRVLLLQYNRIKSMDLFVLGSDSMHLSQVNLRENKLISLDISNFISESPFCLFDYSRNVIEELTNEGNRTLNKSKTYEGGFVDLQGNMFTTFPDFKELLNLGGIEELGSLLAYGFDFRETAIGCDCVLEPLMEKAKDFVKTYWRDYFDVKCASPESLKGKSVVNVSLDDFVCKPKDGCPLGCDCKDIPSQRTLFVNCNNTCMTEFPEQLPFSKYSPNINLNLSGNEITTIRNVPYLNSISNLDMSQNKLEEIDEEVVKALENASIDLSGNLRITSLPHSMQYRNMCSLNLNNLVLDCTCKSKWMETWMNVKSCSKSDNIQCRVENHGLMPAKEFSLDMLDCYPKDLVIVTVSVAVAGILMTLIICATLLFQFRYDVLIIMLKFQQKNPNAVQPQFSYDAFVSFDTENNELCNWVYMTLVPQLEETGYKIFLPDRDLPFGEVRATATIDILQSTRNFVLILSESYINQEDQIWTDNEWKYGWHMFTSDSQKNIVLINYDHVSSFDVDHQQIKAFLRVGGQVDFLNSRRNIMELICDKLGPKCAVQTRFPGLLNKKQIFVPVCLFQADKAVKEAEDNDSVYDICIGWKDNKGTFSDTYGNNYADTITDRELNTKEQNTARNIDLNTVQGNGLSTNSDGILDIKELKRPVNGTLKYWM